MNKHVFRAMLGMGMAVFIFLIVRNISYQSNLKEISHTQKVELEIINAFNERGSYILNDTYYVSSATRLIGPRASYINDGAIWRPPGYKHIPRISDISAPFFLRKKEHNDTITIVKSGETMLFLLSDD